MDCMKVGHLIKRLQIFDPNLEVMISTQKPNLDEIVSAAIENAFETNKNIRLCGRYELLNEGNQSIEMGESFDLIVLFT